MKLIKPLYITGIDISNGQFMVGGFFKMHDEVGYPIDCCIDEARERKIYIDWLEALCDCWLNQCLKYDSFVRQVQSQLPHLTLNDDFIRTTAMVLAMFPKMKQTKNPVDTVCKYIMERKRKGSWSYV